MTKKADLGFESSEERERRTTMTKWWRIFSMGACLVCLWGALVFFYLQEFYHAMECLAGALVFFVIIVFSSIEHRYRCLLSHFERSGLLKKVRR